LLEIEWQKKDKCIFCGKECDISNLVKWHNKNCKFNPNFLIKEKCKFCNKNFDIRIINRAHNNNCKNKKV